MPHVFKHFFFLIQIYEHIQVPEGERGESAFAINNVDHSNGGKQAVVQFTAASVAVMENEGKVRLGIKRTGLLEKAVSVR